MSSLRIPAPPEGLRKMSTADAHAPLQQWLMDVARTCGEPSLNRVLGPDWPGTNQQRASIGESHVEVFVNECRQLASESSYQAARERGEWGV